MFLVTRWTTENDRGLCACMYVPDSDDLFCVSLTYPEDPCPFVMFWRRRVSVLERVCVWGEGGGERTE